MVFIQNCLRILGFGDKHNYTHNYQTGNNRKPVHHVVIYSQIEAQRVLEFIGPRLVIKKRQADLLLEWLAIKKPRTHDSHPSIVRPREEEIYWELRTLNHRGNQLVGVMPEQEAIATK
ncbi:MAG TPA: hypothetical protein VGS11_10770 [Candidatus Bathyarchaeia archaeon]|nr:hypothetical protein [Candidatus Bathyarchaeia archaeon]